MGVASRLNASGTLVWGVPATIVACLAFLSYRRTHLLMFLFLGIGAVFVVGEVLVLAFVSDGMPTQLLGWLGLACFGWGLARSRTIDYTRFRASRLLPGIPRGPSRVEFPVDYGKPYRNVPGPAFLIVLGLLYLYLKPDSPFVGYTMVVFGGEWLVAYFLYRDRLQ